MTHKQAAKMYGRLYRSCARVLNTLDTAAHFESDFMEGKVREIQTPAQFRESLEEAQDFFYDRLKWAAGIRK